MEVRISKNGKVGILQGFILVLFGIFLSTFTFAVIIRLFGQETYSLWIGIIVNVLLAGTGIYYFKNKAFKIVSYSMLGTIIVGTILFIVAIQIASGMLEGI
jgi:membrane protein CcdC involved in cytochrome C biogenesis